MYIECCLITVDEKDQKFIKRIFMWNILYRGERTVQRGTYDTEGNVLYRGERTVQRGTYGTEGNILYRGERTVQRGTYCTEGTQIIISHTRTFSVMIFSKLAPASWKLVSCDAFSSSVNILTLSSYMQ